MTDYSDLWYTSSSNVPQPPVADPRHAIDMNYAEECLQAETRFVRIHIFSNLLAWQLRHTGVFGL